MKEFDKLIFVSYIAWCSVAITYAVVISEYAFVILVYFVALALGFTRYKNPNKTSERFYKKPFKYWRNQLILNIVFLFVSVPLVFYWKAYNVYALSAMLLIDVILLTLLWNQIKTVDSLGLFKNKN